jgi:hypothetical protein
VAKTNIRITFTSGADDIWGDIVKLAWAIVNLHQNIVAELK